MSTDTQAALKSLERQVNQYRSRFWPGGWPALLDLSEMPDIPLPCARCGEAVCECADSDPDPDGLLASYFAGSADLRRAVAAVLHELEHGPASEGDPAAIAWCAKVLRSVTDSSRISTPAPAPQSEEREAPSFGAALREARVASGLSLRDAALMLGTTTVRLGEVERGVDTRLRIRTPTPEEP